MFDTRDLDISTDSDADGVVDAFELDDDNDGIIDFADDDINRYPTSRSDPEFMTFKNTPISGVIDVNEVAVDPNEDPVLIRTNTLETANGTLSGLGDGFLFEDGAFTYKPEIGFFGLDTFDYYLCDLRGCSGPFVATIIVEGLPIEFQTGGFCHHFFAAAGYR